ncbi:hypothetical protein BDV06DRAFT_190713 [Aspergillus oleicola]
MKLQCFVPLAVFGVGDRQGPAWLWGWHACARAWLAASCYLLVCVWLMQSVWSRCVQRTSPVNVMKMRGM